MFCIMNLDELHRLEEEIEQLEDVQEKEVRGRLIERLMEKITDYDVQFH